jgi:hypothetical protein
MIIIVLEEFSMVKVVEDVFSQGFLDVHENDTLSSCLSLFKCARWLVPKLCVEICW